MAASPYFNFYSQQSEQGLMDDFVVESVRQYAHDMMYLPRDINVRDNLMTEPIVQTYNKAIDIEMYIKNWSSYEGEGQLLSTFGLDIKDSMSLIMTKRSFTEFVNPYTDKLRPWEGDCIYVPMLKAIYQVKFVSDTNPAFFILGKNYAWEISCELLEFNNEHFETGIPEIDSMNPDFEHYDDPDYDLESYDKTAQNQFIQDESDQIVDWSEKNPFSGDL